MAKHIKIVCSVFIIISMLITGTPYLRQNVYAEVDYDAEIEKLGKEIEEIQQRQSERNRLINSYMNDVGKQEELISLVQEQVDGLEAKVGKQESLIEAKQQDIERKIANLDHLDAKIRETENDIEKVKLHIEEIEEQNKLNITRFGEIVKTMYMSENMDPIAQLMGSTDFFDLLVRAEMLENISERNIEFMKQLLADIEEQEKLILKLEDDINNLESDKERAAEEKKLLEQEKSVLKTEYARLESEMNAEYNSLWQIVSQKEALKSQIKVTQWENAKDAELQEEANRMVAELIRQKQRANTSQEVYSSGEFLWPLSSNYQMITTYFGYDAWRSSNHYGIDVGNGGIGGAPIYAAQSGTVITAYNDGAWHGGYGNYVVIDHGDGVSTLYAHGQTGGTTVSTGDYVQKGDVIAHVGSTGWSTGNHLHFEVRIDGVAVNPFNYSYENSNF